MPLLEQAHKLKDAEVTLEIFADNDPMVLEWKKNFGVALSAISDALREEFFTAVTFNLSPWWQNVVSSGGIKLDYDYFEDPLRGRHHHFGLHFSDFVRKKSKTPLYQFELRRVLRTIALNLNAILIEQGVPLFVFVEKLTPAETRMT